MKNKIGFLLAILLLTCCVLCSCRVYISEDDVGRYFLYDNNVKTDTWIEFSKNRTSWKDSNGNAGYIRDGGDGGTSLYVTDEKTGLDTMLYKGYIRNGVFSFYEVEDLSSNAFKARDFYTESNNSAFKNSSAYDLKRITFRIEPLKEVDVDPLNVYDVIGGCFRTEGYPIFVDFIGEESNNYRVEDDGLYLNYVVKDCSSTQAIIEDILKSNDVSPLSIKDENGNVALTSEDLKNGANYRGVYEFSRIDFDGAVVREEVNDLYSQKPNTKLFLYVFDEYVSELETETVEGKTQLKDFSYSAKNAGLLRKAMEFHSLSLVLELVD